MGLAFFQAGIACADGLRQLLIFPFFVIAGLDPAIHDEVRQRKSCGKAVTG
jgi:hypothetical protein